MPKKKTPKILNAHAKRRAEERYGLELNKDARREIVQMIQSNQAEFVSRTSNNRTLWKVPYQDETLNVVYDKARQAMCTVLPKDAAEFQKTDWSEAEKALQKQSARQAITDELSMVGRQGNFGNANRRFTPRFSSSSLIA